MFYGLWCFQSHLVLPCTNRHQKQPYLTAVQLFMLLVLVLLVVLVLPYTNRHQNKPFKRWFSCLYSWAWCLNRIVYFRVQIGTKNQAYLTGVQLFVLMGVVLLAASCTSVYKQAPEQTYLTDFQVVYVYGFGAFLSHLVLSCTYRHQNKPI